MCKIILIAPLEMSITENIVEFEKPQNTYIEQMKLSQLNSYFYRRISENIGLGNLAAFLRFNNVAVKIINMPIENLTIQNVVSCVCENNPIIVGISLLYDLHLKNTLELIIQLRKSGYENHITLGGTFSSLVYERLLNDIKLIDSIAVGDAEHTLYSLLRSLEGNLLMKDIEGLAYRENNSTISYKPPQKIYDEINLPIACRDSLSYLYKNNVKVSTASIFASRGCNNNCIYCCAPSMRISHNKIWRPRNVDNLVSEIKYLVEQFGVSYLYFCDDNFCGYSEIGRAHLDELASKIIQNDIHIKFHAEIRADAGVTREQLLQLKLAGLDEALVGIESGSQNCLNRWKKGTTVEKNAYIIKILRDIGIKVVPAFIMVDPYITPNEFEETTKFIINNDLFNIDEPWTLFNKMIIYPGTLLEDKLKKDKLIIDTYDVKLDESTPLNQIDVFIKAFKIEYELSDPIINALWKIYEGEISDIVDIVYNKIPKWLSKKRHKKINIIEIMQLRRWRKNLKTLLTNYLNFGVTYVLSEYRYESKLLDAIKSIRNIYDMELLGKPLSALISEKIENLDYES
jgi:radical SAM superfamily enzyme YgiQ (UPF0313 family)